MFKWELNISNWNRNKNLLYDNRKGSWWYKVVLIKLSDFSEQYVQYTHIKCGL